ncbi:YkgJ family cysteine cluster protein [Candidatus Micrarchaeota archaeon]|nr:YkgJ family cysteine cluster protein [Candidatus Micrarchaeota archaeon]
MVNPCKLCTAHCCKDYLITVTSFDVLRVIRNTGKKPDEFLEFSDPPMLNADDETILECYEQNERFDFVLAFKSHQCYFLGKNNECTIHQFAPLSCKLYPYNSSGKITPRALCPLISKVLFKIDPSSASHARSYMAQLKEYKQIVAKWNRSHGKKSECLNFLLQESYSLQKSFKF